MVKRSRRRRTKVAKRTRRARTKVAKRTRRTRTRRTRKRIRGGSMSAPSGSGEQVQRHIDQLWQTFKDWLNRKRGGYNKVDDSDLEKLSLVLTSDAEKIENEVDKRAREEFAAKCNLDERSREMSEEDTQEWNRLVKQGIDGNLLNGPYSVRPKYDPTVHPTAGCGTFRYKNKFYQKTPGFQNLVEESVRSRKLNMRWVI